jgi:hypothetical protein
MKSLSECRYSAFISYAHADDQATDGWISQFSDFLRMRLQNRLGRIGVKQLQDMHLSGRNGPVVGSLPDALLNNVADSYAMIIVVFNAYTKSDWCLQELDYFKKAFGAEGLSQRLYVVAMSKSAMDDIVARPDWARLTLPNQLWIPFYRDEEVDEPARVRLDHGGLSQRFDGQLIKLLDAFEGAVKQDMRQAPPHSAPPPARPTAAGVSRGAGGPLLFGVPSPELAEAASALAAELRVSGLAVQELGADSLDGDFEEFDQASALILPFGTGGQHLKPFKFSPGGHLAAQRDAWLDKGGAADALIWLDLRDVAIDAPANKGHAELVASIEAQALKPAALRERLAPPPTEPCTPGSEETEGERVNIYIESNQHDTDLWQDLGERIKSKWEELVLKAGATRVPPLCLEALGLPLQKIDEERLDDADGVVLLWGQKPEVSLRAQIKKVEGKWPRDPPPRIVAYLMPQQPDPGAKVEARLWSVLRFQDADSPRIDICPSEADRLQRFLNQILERRMKRPLPQGAATAAAAT